MEAKVEDALSYLQKSAAPGGLSLYDHLADVIGHLLERRAENAVDTFEALSYELRTTRPGVQKQQQQQQQQQQQPQADVALCERRLEMLRRDREEREDEEAAPEPLLDDAPVWEAAGVGPLCRRTDIELLALSVRELATQRGLKHTRLWGKMLGRTADYFVLETDFVPADATATTPKPAAATAKAAEAEEDGDGDDDEEAVAKRKAAEEEAAKAAAAEEERALASAVPPEDEGVGSNRFSYWVCHRAGEPWTKLSPVTPAQIAASRRIRKLLTGNLDAEVVCAPPGFPGRERHYLRALIARISAATQVSPKGFFSAAEPEDMGTDDDELPPEALEVIEQEEWTGMQAAALLDARNWAHHAPALLVQGRCSFWRAPRERPAISGTDEDEGDETDYTTEGDGGAASDAEPAELPPPLLSVIADDAGLGEDGGVAAWSLRAVHGIPGKTGCVVVSSNRWPGAHAAAFGPKFLNVYVGNGLKYATEPWMPELPKMPETEFVPKPPEDAAASTGIAEAADPTLEEENAEKAQAEAEAAAKAEQERAEAERRQKEKEAAAVAASAQQGDAGTDGEDTAGAGATTGASADEFDDETLDEDEDATESEATTS